MIEYLADRANAVTACSFFFAVVGVFLALNGQLELGAAAMLWTWSLDHWDGHIARTTRHKRLPGTAAFGKNFDGFGDFVHGVWFPAVVIILVGDGSVISFVASLLLVMAGAIRLSYFENVGLTAEAKFIGIPVSYATPLLAVIMLLRPLIWAEIFPTMLALAFTALAALYVSTFVQVPAIQGRAIPIATMAAIALSLALIAISLSRGAT
ncbi:CDP-alcohol phosphatidyltransferase family protein [Bradyrhizobium elkanii]|uniref:CDP-alcohol phosphatidyltransferase family protein n=1 Tax=Bradyrhizobium elkanii TaxID=29448 RepID=UPI001BA86A9E|nr:CDP-alcohol phosphatidyltransferase family protein [Bradyrhizobium elkanii]MBR1164610.1 CDP-alcohol phosphatidyltransferase family protein [Bradyrhizobium elkanii]